MERDTPIASEVLQFIDRNIASVDQLEILLLLRGDRTRSWSAAQVGAELRSNPEVAASRLAAMCELGLLVCEPAGAYRYAPVDADVDRVVARFEEAYRHYRLRIIERIFSKPDGLSAFADAFRIRKGP